MNLSVYTQGKIITPNGLERHHRESGPLLSQTRTEDAYEIARCSGTKIKYNLYKKLYGDPGGLLRQWLIAMETGGFEIIWEIH